MSEFGPKRRRPCTTNGPRDDSHATHFRSFRGLNDLGLPLFASTCLPFFLLGACVAFVAAARGLFVFRLLPFFSLLAFPLLPFFLADRGWPAVGFAVPTSSSAGDAAFARRAWVSMPFAPAGANAAAPVEKQLSQIGEIVAQGTAGGSYNALGRRRTAMLPSVRLNRKHAPKAPRRQVARALKINAMAPAPAAEHFGGTGFMLAGRARVVQACSACSQRVVCSSFSV